MFFVGYNHLAPVLRRRRAVVLMSFDAVVLALAYVLFGWLRYHGPVTADLPWGSLALVAGIAIVVQLIGGWASMVYRGRDAVGSTDETVNLAGIGLIAAIAAHLANVFGPMDLVGRTVPWGAGLTAVAVSVSARALWRRYVEASTYVDSDRGRRTVVVGAGEGGQQIVRSMRSTPDSPFIPVALVDDDPWRRRFRICGVEVRGTIADLERVVREYAAQVVLVAIPSADKELIQDISDRAKALAVDVKVLPSVPELFGQQVTIRDVRDINLADLLGRKTVDTDLDSIADFIRGKRVLVTGAGGSIGSELSRQISKWDPAELMMLDRDESALHGVQLSIHGHGLLDSPDVILADIRDPRALERIFDERRPQVVFHAAALKHLPMLEQYPLEALQTNVLGTLNVLEAAHRAGVERFVNISTDKAADPTSVLGLSKRVAERITADFAQNAEGSYMSVRFGNVLGSRGSVLTAWTAQIAQGGPVTVTHPDVTRYFMTVHEACQLVLQAGAIGRDGEVMILDMGEPVRLDDVARKLIEQSGKDIEIVYTGLREGEKLDEILIAGDEADRRPVHDLITHVDVPPLGGYEVLGTSLELEADKAKHQLREWCEVSLMHHTSHVA